MTAGARRLTAETMPARLRDLIRAARTLGVTIEEPSSGSHYKAVMKGRRPYPLPCHNGEKSVLGDDYLRGFCRAFGLDLDELKKLL